MTQSDAGVLKHTLSILLAELPSIDAAAMTPFCACFSKVGVTNVSNFISMEPNTYDSISFFITPNGDDDHQLNIIQMKKINSLCWTNFVSTLSLLGICSLNILSISHSSKH
jgi:hypothetical protein